MIRKKVLKSEAGRPVIQARHDGGLSLWSVWLIQVTLCRQDMMMVDEGGEDDAQGLSLF